eukprot:2507898-Pleurochrysis_carterae.AAC.2
MLYTDREAKVEYGHGDEREKGDHLAFCCGARAPVRVGQALVVEGDHVVDVVRRQTCEQHLEGRVDSIARLECNLRLYDLVWLAWKVAGEKWRQRFIGSHGPMAAMPACRRRDGNRRQADAGSSTSCTPPIY